MYLEDFGRLGLQTFPIHSSILGEVPCCQTINLTATAGKIRKVRDFPFTLIEKASGRVFPADISYGSRPAGLEFTDGFVSSGKSLTTIIYLVGGFNYFLCSHLLGEDFHFDKHIFQMG